MPPLQSPPVDSSKALVASQGLSPIEVFNPKKKANLKSSSPLICIVHTHILQISCTLLFVVHGVFFILPINMCSYANRIGELDQHGGGERLQGGGDPHAGVPHHDHCGPHVHRQDSSLNPSPSFPLKSSPRCLSYGGLLPTGQWPHHLASHHLASTDCFGLKASYAASGLYTEASLKASGLLASPGLQ